MIDVRLDWLSVRSMILLFISVVIVGEGSWKFISSKLIFYNGSKTVSILSNYDI